MIDPDFAGFDSTPFQSAIIDADGTIVAVNSAWRSFASQNGASAAVRTGIGLNYLSVCRQARGKGADEAQFAAFTLERLLEGDPSNAAFQYPCHSPIEQRWFLCSTKPLKGEKYAALITHVCMGETPAPIGLRGADKYQADTIIDGDEIPEALSHWRREMLVCQHIQEMTSTGGWELDLNRSRLRWTPETFRIHDLSPMNFEPTLESMLSLYGRRGSSRLRSALLQAEHSGAPFELALKFTSAAGRRIHIRLTGRAEIRRFKPQRLYGIVQDASESVRP